MSWQVRAIIGAVAAVCFVGVVSTSPLAGTMRAQQPGPGLGQSTQHPAGEPVDLKLPPGYTLVSIRGGEPERFVEEGCLFLSSDEPSPACRYVRGLFTVTLVLHFDPDLAMPIVGSNEADCRPDTVTWGGWVLASESGKAQNVVVPIDTCVAADGRVMPILILPPPPTMAASVELTLGGYCLNLSRSVPEANDSFTTGVITNDPALTAVLAAIRGKNLYRRASWFVIQDLIWDYTDGEGLTPEGLAQIAELP